MTLPFLKKYQPQAILEEFQKDKEVSLISLHMSH